MNTKMKKLRDELFKEYRYGAREFGHKEAVEFGWDARKVSEEDLIRFDAICATAGVHTIIVGHMHPTSQRVITRGPNTLIVLKRGITTLSL